MSTIYVVAQLGSGQVGATVAYRTLTPAGVVVEDWTTEGVVETGREDCEGEYAFGVDVGSRTFGRLQVAVDEDGDWLVLVDDWYTPDAFAETAEQVAVALTALGYTALPITTLRPGEMQATRYTQWILPAVDVGELPSDRTKLWWTVKRNAGDDDDQALVQIEENDGLVVLMRDEPEAPITGASGTLVYDDELFTVTPGLLTAASELVPAHITPYAWDIVYEDADGERHRVARGTILVDDTPTHGG